MRTLAPMAFSCARWALIWASATARWPRRLAEISRSASTRVWARLGVAVDDLGELGRLGAQVADRVQLAGRQLDPPDGRGDRRVRAVGHGVLALTGAQLAQGGRL